MDAQRAARQYELDVIYGDTGYEGLTDAFRAGAAWALREFGDMLEEASTNGSDASRTIALLSWWAEAHHIADGIEEVSND